MPRSCGVVIGTARAVAGMIVETTPPTRGAEADGGCSNKTRVAPAAIHRRGDHPRCMTERCRRAEGS